jgi:hypothetical protein
MQSQRFPLFSSFRPRLACVPPVVAWGAPWLPCAAGHAVVGPVRPDRAGGGRLAPPMPQGGPPSPRHLWPPPTGLPTPLCVNFHLRPAFGEGPRGSRPLPQVVLRPALRVEAPRVPVQAFGSRSQGDAPSDTTGHQVPRWEPEGTPTRLVSPAGAGSLSPGPPGFPIRPTR